MLCLVLTHEDNSSATATTPCSFRVALEHAVPIPEPPANHVRIRVSAASLNPVDGKWAKWWSLVDEQAATTKRHFVLGLDAAGVIDAVGEGVDASVWPVGTWVCAHLWLGRGDGSFAEYCIAHVGTLVAIHDRVPMEVAAALPCAMWTAYKALVTKLRVQPRKSILVTGGNGGVGGFCLQIAKHLGLSRIITTCSAKSADRVQRLGATDWINYRTEEDIASAVRQIVPQGVDYVVDNVGSASASTLLAALAIDGELAAVAGSPTRPEGISALNGLSVHDVCLGYAAYRSGAVDQLGKIGSKCMEWVAQGFVEAMVERRISLHDVVEEVQEIAQGSTTGKTVVVISGTDCNS